MSERSKALELLEEIEKLALKFDEEGYGETAYVIRHLATFFALRSGELEWLVSRYKK